MSERDRFVAAIIADPADDTVRLAFADWLDEHGEAERAEFIRVQCEISVLCERHRTGKATPGDTARQQVLFDRDAELVPTVYPVVVYPVMNALRGMGIDPYECVYNRGGWLSHVTCFARRWLAYGDTLLASHPVTAVTLDEPAEWTSAITDLLFRLPAEDRLQLAHPANRSKPVVLADLFRAVWKGVRFCIKDEASLAGATLYGRPLRANSLTLADLTAAYTDNLIRSFGLPASLLGHPHL